VCGVVGIPLARVSGCQPAMRLINKHFLIINKILLGNNKKH